MLETIVSHIVQNLQNLNVSFESSFRVQYMLHV